MDRYKVLLKCCGISHGLCTESLIKCCSMWIAEMPVTLEQQGRKECALNKNTERSSGLYFLIFHELVKSWKVSLYILLKFEQKPLLKTSQAVWLTHAHRIESLMQERVRKGFSKKIGQAALDKHRTVWKQPSNLTFSTGRLPESAYIFGKHLHIADTFEWGLHIFWFLGFFIPFVTVFCLQLSLCLFCQVHQQNSIVLLLFPLIDL